MCIEPRKGVAMFSRDLNDLTKVARSGYEKFKTKMDAAGIPFIVTCTVRKYEAQFALYAQGRMALDEVNKLRKQLGWAPIGTKQNKIVTWTIYSSHLPVTALKAAQGLAEFSDIGKSEAFDIVIMRDRKTPTWEPKEDINDNEIPDYLEAALIGQKCGLVPGAFWKDADLCHYQIES